MGYNVLSLFSLVFCSLIFFLSLRQWTHLFSQSFFLENFNGKKCFHWLKGDFFFCKFFSNAVSPTLIGGALNISTPLFPPFLRNFPRFFSAVLDPRMFFSLFPRK